MGKDMTTGSPLKLILFFSIPLLIGNVFQQFYSMADTVIVGRTVGVQALAAVGSTGAISFLVLGFVMGLSGGFAVVTAQRFGAGDYDGMRNSIGITVILSVAFTIVVTAISMLATVPLLRIMQTPDDIFEDAYRYIIVIFGGIFAAVFYNMLASILRALGDSKTPLYFLIIASVLNIILDFVCILGMKMGVAGAGYATVAAQLIAGLLCLVYMIKKYPILKMKREDWRFRKDFAMAHMRVGLPMALQFSITAIGVMVLQAALNEFGSTVVASYTAASKVEMIFSQPMVTLGVTIATYAAQNLGAQQYGRIREGVKVSSILALLIALIGGVAVVFLGRVFVRLFISNPTGEIYSYAQTYLNTIALFFIPLSFLNLLRNALQGMGSAFVPMMAGATELVMRTVACMFLPQRIGYLGVCLASPLAWVGAVTPLIIAYFLFIRKFPTMDPVHFKQEQSPDPANQ